MPPPFVATQRLPLARRLGIALKAFRMVWSGRGGGYGSSQGGGLTSFWFGSLPGSQRDWIREAGDPSLNSAVSICLGWIADNFSEPDLQVTIRRRDGSDDPVPRHPLVELVENPNGTYDDDTLWAATITDYCVSGEAYWIIAKGARGSGKPIELWWVPSWQMRPRWDPADMSSPIGWYDYFVDGKAYRVERENIVHFRFRYDPFTRRGVSRLLPILREICSDNEVGTFTASILRNMGCPTALMTPKDVQAQFGSEEAALLREMWGDQYGGDNRGMPFVASHQVEVTKLAFTPEELVLDRIGDRPEARICGALRIPAQVVGLNVGEKAKTYANYGEARQAAYHDCLMPLQKRLASALNRQLLPYLGNPARERVTFDYADVEALGEDSTVLSARMVSEYQGGVRTRNEARAEIGLPPVEESPDAESAAPDEDEPEDDEDEE